MQIHCFVPDPGGPGCLLLLSRFFPRTAWLTALLLFLTIPVPTGAQPAGSPRPLPPAQAPRTRTYDVQHIALDLRFSLDQKQAAGTATLTLSPLATLDKIALDAGFLTIRSVHTAAGTPLAFDYDGSDRDDALQIRLDRAYTAGEIIRLTVDYHTNYVNESDPNNLWGSYGKGLRFFAPTSTEPRKRRQIWSMGEPQGNRYWFPGRDAPGDFRTTELRATVDKGLQVISNGNLVSNRENADGSRTFYWKMDTPYANHQTALIVGDYVAVTQHWNGIDLHSFGYPDETEATRASVVRLPDMLRFFSDIIGTKYPYPAYNQVFVQDFPWGGGHNTGSSTVSENMVDDAGTHADFFYLWDGVEAQDLAAQWFGNLLTPADWSEVWLSKSFALYFDCLYTEYKNGHDEMLLWNRNFQHSTVMADWQAGLRRPIVTRHYDDPATMCFDNFALRGAMVLHLLRKHLGAEKWRKAIRMYVKNNAGKAVTTDDFRRAVESAAGEPMDWFFEQWLYRSGHPVFEVSKQYDAGKKQLLLIVRQVQQPDPDNPYAQAGFFRGKIEVEIDGRIEPVRLEAKAENRFVFAAAAAPKLVNFDVENTWIKELRYEKSTGELLYQLQNSRDIVARRAALLELAATYRQETTPAADKTNILAAFRTLISGQSYWRLRYSALLTLQGLVAAQPLDEATVSLLLSVIRNEKSWNRAAAITFLGLTKDPQYAGLYIRHFNDESDRVVNAAANALGKTGSPLAFDALMNLKDKPSWKNQSLIAALNGLRELGDPRGTALALAALADSAAAPRWTLATPVWDFRLAAAETLVALGQGRQGYDLVYPRLMQSLAENDVNDIFSNVLLLVTLGDARALAIFPVLKEKYRADANALKAVEGYESQLAEAVK